MTQINDVKEDFNFGDKIYLNNASVSLVPKPAIKAMNNFLIQYNALGADSKTCDSYVNDKLINTRKIISKLINCKPEELVLVNSTTDGINIVANGLNLTSSSNIITRGGAHEHHANYYPWLNLGKIGTQVKNLKIDENGVFDLVQLENFIDKETKLVSLSHALYNTGAILPVEEAGIILSERFIPFLVDAAQTVGCLNSIDVRSIKCDFAAFTGAKWLCGPMGTGILYCKKESAHLLTPDRIGGESAMIYDDDKLIYKDIPSKFQTGFRNYVGMVGLAASAEYLSNVGFSNIRNHIMNLAQIMREELTNMSNVTIHGPEDPKLRTSIVSFTTSKSADDLVKQLESQGIVLATREIYDKKIVRASPHFFNTEEEILHVTSVIKTIIK